MGRSDLTSVDKLVFGKWVYKEEILRNVLDLVQAVGFQDLPSCKTKLVLFDDVSCEIYFGDCVDGSFHDKQMIVF